jgi:hypothetical protein
MPIKRRVGGSRDPGGVIAVGSLDHRGRLPLGDRSEFFFFLLTFLFPAAKERIYEPATSMEIATTTRAPPLLPACCPPPCVAAAANK